MQQYDIETDKDFGQEYYNAIIIFSDGLKIGINIWSAKYFQNNIHQIDLIDDEFAILPDVIVKNYQADSIRKAIINLLEKQNFLEGRGFPCI